MVFVDFEELFTYFTACRKLLSYSRLNRKNCKWEIGINHSFPGSRRITSPHYPLSAWYPNSQTHFKNPVAKTAKFLKCVWPFSDIIHERVKSCFCQTLTSISNYSYNAEWLSRILALNFLFRGLGTKGLTQLTALVANKCSNSTIKTLD